MYSILLLEDDLLFASSIEDFLVCEGFWFICKRW